MFVNLEIISNMAAPMTKDVGQQIDRNQNESSNNRPNKISSSTSSDLLNIRGQYLQ